jgi:transcriptional regulator with XRE-family HTH domain
VLRAVRKSSGIRIDDLAGMVGVSKQFASDVENGKDRADGAGVSLAPGAVRVSVEFHDSAAASLSAWRSVQRKSGMLTVSEARVLRSISSASTICSKSRTSGR